MSKDNNLKEILGYEIVEQEVKKYAERNLDNPNFKSEIEQWLSNSIGKGHLNGIRICNLHQIDYSIDPDELDEFDLAEYTKKVKHNNKVCPKHRTCPVYLNGVSELNEKCTLELVDTKFLINGLLKELEVEETDFNDQILIGQLVSSNIIYNRAMEHLAYNPLVEEIKTYQKGTTKIETKTNEHFAIADRCLVQMEKLRKSLLLNREDKLRVKQVKKANNELTAKKAIEEKIKDIENKTVINKDLIESILVEENQAIENETPKTEMPKEKISSIENDFLDI